MEERAVATTNGGSVVSMFDFGGSMDKAMRFADTLSKSQIVPDTFRNNMASCLIALDMANRMRRNPLEVMQALYIVHGKPSFSSSFLISLINSCGYYEPLRFRFSGEGDSRACVAWTVDRRTGETVEGPEISMKMANAEGWVGRAGSKWKTMPEVMLRYRAASFFSRAYCPDLTGGFHSVEEVQETDAIAVTSTPVQSIEVQHLDINSIVAAASEKDGMKRRRTIWNDYLEHYGDRDRAIAEISVVTESRGSKDWTLSDMDELERQLAITKQSPEALDIDSDTSIAEEMGIGEDPVPKEQPKPVTELERLRTQLSEGLTISRTPEEAEAWVAENFGGKAFKALTKDDLKTAIAKLNAEMDAKEGV